MSEQEQEQLNNDLENENQENHESEQKVEQEHRDDEHSDQNQDEEYVVQFGDEEPVEESEEDQFNGQPAPQWVKEVRQENRDNKKRIKELEAQLSQQNKPSEIELGEKPTLESVGFDSDEYETKLAEWFERKRAHDDQEKQKQADQEKANKAWQDRLNAYESKKADIKTKVRDFDIAEEQAREVLSKTQQGILIHAADNPELLVYHLGKNPEKAKTLAAIQDPIQFAFAAAKIDAQLKVQTRKPQTNPERKPSGSAPLSGVVDSTLEKLREEATRTGDFTKVVAYKKQKRNK
ncbi:hypothetical protein [Acinetobacter ursingii]|uniref:hypothetical protein n=1 Tax=Acinetobacter ursingii TaxID=108980 RepID=UPI0032B502D5